MQFYWFFAVKIQQKRSKTQGLDPNCCVRTEPICPLKQCLLTGDLRNINLNLKNCHFRASYLL
jgi:hypothetical protein